MLILQRKKGESLILDHNIKITVAECGNEGVKLAIDAPKEMKILREELLEAVRVNREAAANQDKLEKIRGMFKERKKTE